jgi:phosphopantothenoylcysteine decarboxylase/phosphopantothenate--cysteine ligase
MSVQNHFNSCDGGIFAAAVSDYKPAEVADKKIKKSEETLTLTLKKNPDILYWAGSQKTKNQWLVGFALETNDALKNAEKKLKKKNLDAIVVNTLEDKGAGFGHDTNKITILDLNNNSTKFELTSKKEAANNILDFIMNNLV